MSNDTTRIERIYDGIAPEWDERQGRAERKLIGDTMRHTLASHLRGNVLEIGTGTGITLRHLTSSTQVTAFTGIDLSQGMLRQAKTLIPTMPFPVTLAHMNADHLDFPDATFDTVTVSLTLCTVPDPAQTLREMARVCKPDGHIVLLEHVRAPNPLIAGLQHLVNPLQKRALGCNLNRPTDRLIRELGFRIEHQETRLLSIFHLIVARPPAP